MADNPETVQLAKEFAAEVAKLDKALKALKPKFDAAVAELAKQLKAKNPGSVDVALALVQKLTSEAEHLLRGVVDARSSARALAEDTEYLEAHLKAVTRLTAVVDGVENAVAGMTKKSRALEVAAEQFRDGSVVTEKEGELKVSRLSSNAHLLARQTTQGVAAAQKALAAAKSAQAARDAAALKAARESAIGLHELVEDGLKAMDDYLPKLKAGWVDKAPSPEAQKRWASEYADITRLHAENRKRWLEWGDLRKQIDALQVAEVDAAKAAAALEIDAKHKGELAKALQGDDAAVTRKLEALARKLDLPGSGREMLARLRKARHV